MTVPTIITLTEEMLGLPNAGLGIKKFPMAGRAIIFNKDGLIAIYRPGPLRSYRLPGGKTQPHETADGAAIRETAEEIGAKIKLTSAEIARAIEVKDAKRVQQTSCYFIGQYLTSTKRRRGRLVPGGYLAPVHNPEWVTLDAAIEMIRDFEPCKYKDKFVQARDMAFLEWFRDNKIQLTPSSACGVAPPRPSGE